MTQTDLGEGYGKPRNRCCLAKSHREFHPRIAEMTPAMHKHRRDVAKRDCESKEKSRNRQ